MGEMVARKAAQAASQLSVMRQCFDGFFFCKKWSLYVMWWMKCHFLSCFCVKNSLGIRWAPLWAARGQDANEVTFR